MSSLMTTKECDICCLPIKKATARNKTSIKCPKCEYEACMSCYITYMKQLAIEESCYPKCMKCLTVWEYSFIIANIPDKFRKEFAALRSEVLFSLISSLIPTYTNKFYHLYKLKTIIKRNMTVDDFRTVYDILLHHQELISGERNALAQESASDANYKLNVMIYLKHTDTVRYIMENRRNSHYVFSNLLYNFLMYELKYSFKKQLEEYAGLEIKINNTNKKCIMDDCLGYLYNWICCICHTKVCHKCEMISNEDHKCKKENLDNIRLIRKDCVACPRCATYINRIEGCPQMWCTYCNTPFDWLTGKIVDIKNFHNPHYIEYIREKRKENPNFQIDNNQLNNNNNEILCNDELLEDGELFYIVDNIREMLSEIFNDDFYKYSEKYKKMSSENHIEYIMKYINKEITLDKLKNIIQMQDKKLKYMAEIIDINNVFQMKSIEVYNYHARKIRQLDEAGQDGYGYSGSESDSDLNPESEYSKYNVNNAIDKEIELLTHKIFDLIDESNIYRAEISKIYKYVTNPIKYDIKNMNERYHEMQIRISLDKEIKYEATDYEHYHFNMLITKQQLKFSDIIKTYICENCLGLFTMVPLFTDNINKPDKSYILIENKNMPLLYDNYDDDDDNSIIRNLLDEIEDEQYPSIKTIINNQPAFLYNSHICKHANEYLYIEKLKNMYFKNYTKDNRLLKNDNVV